MYANNQCCGRRDGQHSEWFREDCGKAGMRHTPLLFLVLVSRVIRNATSDRPRYLVWGLNELLRNTDIGLLPFSQKDIQKRGKVGKTVETFGLKTHPTKTKLMKLKSHHKKDRCERESTRWTISNIYNIFSFVFVWTVADFQMDWRWICILSNPTSSSTTVCFRYMEDQQEEREPAQRFWRKLPQKNPENTLRSATQRNRRTLEHQQQRRWRWLGRVLLMDSNSLPHAALKWIPHGKENTTALLDEDCWWRWMERRESNLAGHDRAGWRRCVGALCSNGSK